MSGAINSEDITVLNFYAPRCPSCRAAHKNIINEVNQLPENLQILNVDYDSNTELRQKYDVTSQHTFVLIDRNGNKIKSIQ
jgi:thiol-disulfide isomerase/thioredoxin